MEEIAAGPLLSQINNPDDLKKLNKNQLVQVCDELRQFIVDCVSIHGGHFGASLGVVELTVALHYVFNTPDDQLVWDVNTEGLVAFRNGAKAYTMSLALGIRPPLYLPRWVWL